MNLKAFFQKHGIHFIAIGLFLIVGIAYFSPQFNGYGLKQYDIEQFKAMSSEINHFREATGEEPLWTNSAFGGMPATQISVVYAGNWIKACVTAFITTFPSPTGIFLLHLFGFYILALCLRIKPVIGILGAFAFAFASYEIIILQAGHNSKALAVAFTPAVLGAFILAFRRNWKWGAILSALFMSFELSVNHLQVSYYLGFLLFFLGLYFAFEALKKKRLKKFGFATGGVLLGYILALVINYGNIAITKDYAKHTIRGGNDVTITPDGQLSTISTDEGLDKEYITNWSYGIGESFTLISPYVKGSHNGKSIAETRFAPIVDDMELRGGERDALMNNRAYWGEQPITSGPVYLGVIVVFLALLGLVFLKDKIKWVFLGVSVLALLLSWGKNFMGLTDLFIEYMPGYNKFRTVTIILVLIELCVPVIAIMLLQKLYEDRDEFKGQSKKFLIVSGMFFVFLAGLKVVGVDNNYSSKQERDYFNEETMFKQYEGQLRGMDPKVLAEQYRVDINNPQQIRSFIDAQVQPALDNFDNVKSFRKKVFAKSTNHSLIVGILGIVIMALFFFTSIPSVAIIGILGVVTLGDLMVVGGNYLGKDPGLNTEYLHWVEEAERRYPISATSGDYGILQDEINANPELEKVVSEGEKRGRDKAEALDYSGRDRRRVIDYYKFAALNMSTNYRVFDFDAGWNGSRPSYFHKSLAGYHGAKLRNIQNVFDFQISRSNNKLLDILNVRYFIQNGAQRKNPTAMGNAWFVSDVKEYETPNDEIRALGKRFEINNVGSGELLINGEEASKADVFGAEKMVYVIPSGNNSDSIKVSLSNGIPMNVKVF
ncbi:MAG: hypothetical protein MK066_11735, partial [Crocinitomicaceae bacterium]|nr:hypothetical protein [Crocinitomicaceae bacterium]